MSEPTGRPTLPMQTKGIDEVRGIRRRLEKLYGLGRIHTGDYLYIKARLDEVEARIVEMDELHEGREEAIEWRL